MVVASHKTPSVLLDITLRQVSSSKIFLRLCISRVCSSVCIVIVICVRINGIIGIVVVNNGLGLCLIVLNRVTEESSNCLHQQIHQIVLAAYCVGNSFELSVDLLLSLSSAAVCSSISGSALRIAGSVSRVIVDSKNLTNIVVASKVRVSN